MEGTRNDIEGRIPLLYVGTASYCVPGGLRKAMEI
jgi:hypothetical protein